MPGVIQPPVVALSKPVQIDFARLDKGRFDINRPPEKPVPVVSLGGQGLSTPGNLTVLSAQMKTAKTSAIMAALASMMTPKGDCLGFTGTWTGGAWIHIDGEQSPFDFDKAIRTCLRRAGLDAPPQWLRSYSTVHLDIDERRELLFAEMERANKEHGRLSGVSVDGLADMCHDPNDSAEAFALVSRFHRAAVQYACPIIVSLHENPGSDNGKTRGHLGSELARKAETNLFLAKDGDGIVTMFSERSRSFCIPKATGPRFAWNDAAGMHLSCDMPPDKRDNAKAADMKRIFGDIFSQKPSFRHGELVAAYVGHESVCERTAKGRIKEATQNGIVAHSVATGLYSRGSL